MEKKKEEMVERSKFVSEMNKRKIDCTIKMMEEKLNLQTENYEKKQRLMEETKKRYEKNKEEQVLIQKEYSKLKNEEIQKILKKMKKSKK